MTVAQPPLIEAISNRNVDRVRQLLAAGSDPNARGPDGRTALQQASRHDEIAMLLIDAGADIAASVGSHINPVWAVGTGRLDVLQRVLEAGEDINCETLLGTPIHVAARAGQAEMVRLLIERGADINANTMIGTPLWDAVDRGHGQCAVLLIEAGAKTDEAIPTGTRTLLTLAVHKRLTEVVAALLARGGTDPNARGKITEVDRENMKAVDQYANATPLLIAARLDELRIVELLLAAGGDPWVRDEDGRRAIDLARVGGHGEVVRRLEQAMATTPEPIDRSADLLRAAEAGDAAGVRAALAGGADVNARDARARFKHSTPLRLASLGGHRELVAILIEAGADPNLSDAGDETEVQRARRLYRDVDIDTLQEMGCTLGRSPLHEAASRGAAEVVDLLLTAGALADAPDSLGNTPLMQAASGGHAGIVERLLDAGADANAVDATRASVLDAAIDSGSAQVVRVLLAAGAKVVQRKNNNMLESAARRNAVDVLDLLLRAGAKVDVVDEVGNTPLIGAAEKGHLEVVRRLLAAGANVNHRNKYGESALTRGATLGISITEYEDARQRNDPVFARKMEVCRAMLDAGADVNALDDAGQGPLAMAVFTLNEPLTRLLLDRGANPKLGSIGGAAPIPSAKEKGFAPDLVARMEAIAATMPTTPPSAPAKPATKRKRTPRAKPQPTLPPLDFSTAADTDAYRSVVADLERRTGTRANVVDAVPGLVHLHVDSRAGFDFEKTRAEFLGRGTSVFWLETLEKNRIGVLPTADQFQVVQAIGTAAPNFDLNNAAIVQWLQALHAEQPFEIIGVSHDTIDGRFLNDVREPMKLARRMYKFCPDIVDQGTGTVDELADLLKQHRRLYFWWD
jgi:ankyrin repeat protein